MSYGNTSVFRKIYRGHSPLMNTATVTATSVQSQKHLEDKDTWTVEPVGFKVEKTAKVTGENGVVKWEPTGSPVELTTNCTERLPTVTVTNTGLIDTYAPVITDAFTTPKGFILDKLSWAEVNKEGTVGQRTQIHGSE